MLAPWFARNLAVFGTILPSAGGHTLWITEYNEQFSIGHEVSLSTYLDWGWVNIIGSKLYSWGELVGRTGLLLGGIFFIFFVAGLWMFRRRVELAPFLVYFVVMFLAMGLLFTFHAPKGAFYHSAPAWLPWAYGIAAAAVGPACTAAGRFWPFLRRPRTHRFVAVAGLAGAIALSVLSSAILFAQWDRSRDPPRAGGGVPSRERGAGRRLHGQRSRQPPAADAISPASPRRSTRSRSSRRWSTPTTCNGSWSCGPGPGETDPLNLWDGSAGVDSQGEHPSFLPAEPAFEGDDVRVFRVQR